MEIEERRVIDGRQAIFPVENPASFVDGGFLLFDDTVDETVRFSLWNRTLNSITILSCSAGELTGDVAFDVFIRRAGQEAWVRLEQASLVTHPGLDTFHTVIVSDTPVQEMKITRRASLPADTLQGDWVLKRLELFFRVKKKKKEPEKPMYEPSWTD